MRQAKSAAIAREQTNKPPAAEQPSREASATPPAIEPVTSLARADPLLTPEQASEYLRGRPGTKALEGYRRNGIGPLWIALARRVYYRQSALDAYLEQCVQVTRPRRRVREVA